MAKLGSYGEPADRPAEQDTFDYFGTEIRVNDLAGETALVDLIEEAGHLDEQDPRGITATKDFLREIVHADDFDTFWDLGRKHRQSVAQMMEVAMSIVEQLTDLPTERSSGSRTGPSATGPSSTADSYSRKRAQLEAEGRPDLALVYLDAEEAGVAS